MVIKVGKKGGEGLAAAAAATAAAAAAALHPGSVIVGYSSYSASVTWTSPPSAPAISALRRVGSSGSSGPLGPVPGASASPPTGLAPPRRFFLRAAKAAAPANPPTPTTA
eukprot:CAMPEP_0117662474 /NCGR_PEP_ID=MMETSP0804-20121206/8071_1 /TAXON_ID=1074897 /ORGANISM="Tetraselmis astigmatica, Strain CCMP880" /LENGTH=109 /DNA_ID=CAMNT_0005469373 /DNA_START=81 /DNA_END=405 /DNA_ORIENTATION=-